MYTTALSAAAQARQAAHVNSEQREGGAGGRHRKAASAANPPSPHTVPPIKNTKANKKTENRPAKSGAVYS